jgi:hypothetical protein
VGGVVREVVVDKGADEVVPVVVAGLPPQVHRHARAARRGHKRVDAQRAILQERIRIALCNTARCPDQPVNALSLSLCVPGTTLALTRAWSMRRCRGGPW